MYTGVHPLPPPPTHTYTTRIYTYTNICLPKWEKGFLCQDWGLSITGSTDTYVSTWRNSATPMYPQVRNSSVFQGHTEYIFDCKVCDCVKLYIKKLKSGLGSRYEEIIKRQRFSSWPTSIIRSTEITQFSKFSITLQCWGNSYIWINCENIGRIPANLMFIKLDKSDEGNTGISHKDENNAITEVLETSGDLLYWE